ncbi:MAG: hypothetical protein PHF00_12960 [Elusimicrobia bacterium]|nr:hypothetical protein [Elusimicrobiota bacterium]
MGAALRRNAWVLAAAALVAAGAAAWLARSPAAVLLRQDRGARWIAVPEPIHLGTHAWSDEVGYFHKDFELDAPASARLELSALRAAEARLDGRIVLASAPPAEWRGTRSIALPRVGPGRHEVLIAVRNRGGPAAVRAALRGCAVETDAGWTASRDGRSWSAARTLGSGSQAELSHCFPSAGAAFLDRLPALLPFFLLAFLWSWCLHTGSGPVWLHGRALTPALWRWLFLAAWGLLALNNIPKVPLNVGYDVGAHMDYIALMARSWRVPLANEGWQMFQPPLYYMLSAPAYAALSRFFEPDTVARLLRLLPFLCGALQVELAYLALRAIWPYRRDLQVMGMAAAGLMPANIYLSQAVSNEGLCGVLSAAVIVLVWRRPAAARAALAAGALLGLAALAKVTAILLAPALAGFWIMRAARGRDRRDAVIWAGLAGLTAVAVAGWYYARNWAALGTPFMGGWDPARGLAWWQYPGYRTWPQLLVWGRALSQPIYSSLSGFWDAFYSTLWLDGNLSSIITFRSRPPWDYRYMLSGSWLALLPSLGILVGALSAVCGGESPQRRYAGFSAACLAIYLASAMALFVMVPAYSSVKASYTVGLLPCYGVLCCAGLERLMRGPWSTCAVRAGMACWAACAYLSYLAC